MFFLWLIFGIIVFTMFVSILIIFSVIKFKIENVHFILPKKEMINKDFKLILELYLFGIIKIFSINIDKTQMERKEIIKQINKINKKLKQDKNQFDVKFFDVCKYLVKNIGLEKFNLKICIGTADAAITAMLVGIVSGIIGILLGIIENNDKSHELGFFYVVPIYGQTNLLKIDFNSIIKIKVWDIINIIYKLSKKGRVNKNDRTSNRGAYAYSNE